MHKTLQLTIQQNGSNITATNSSVGLKINGIRDGDTISFYSLGTNRISWHEITGNWKVNPDGSRIEGTWEIETRGVSGNWNLTKVR
jgi:hypothetical protein